MFKNSYFRAALFSLLLTAAIGSAGGITVWSSGDTLTAAAINANFAHIHNAMVGGHGARLVNADVSATAAIGYTKIQNGRGIARAWVEIPGTCTTGTCTIGESLGVSSVVHASTGVYTVTFNYTATDAVFAAIANSAGASSVKCEGVSTSTTVVTVNCNTMTTAAAVDAPFSLVVFDGN